MTKLLQKYEIKKICIRILLYS